MLKLKYYKTTDVDNWDIPRVNQIIDVLTLDLKEAKNLKDASGYRDITLLLNELRRIRKYKETIFFSHTQSKDIHPLS